MTFPRKTNGVIAVFTLALVVSVAGRALAEPPEVEQLINEGLELRKNQNDEAALEKFKEAYAKSQSPWPLAQAALAEQALGRWIDADDDLSAALAVKKHPWIEKRIPQLEASLSEIEGHIGRIEVRSNVSGAEVRVNGKAAGKLPLSAPIKVVAGSAVVELTSPTHWPMLRTVQVPPRSFVRETFELVEKPAETPAASLPTLPTPVAAPAVAPTPLQAETGAPKHSPTLRYASWVAMGAGVATAGAGLILRLGARSAVSELESGFHSSAEATSLLDKSHSWGTGGTICLISGAALAALGGVLFAVSSD